MTAPLRRSFEVRLDALLRALPPHPADEFAAYLRATQTRDRDHFDSHQTDPCWMLLPRWLISDPRFAARERHNDSDFALDVLWGQYCLFLFVRFHDDVFDDQCRSRSLLFVGDILLMESERAFAKHLDGGAFWKLFHGFVDTSIHGILRVDALQRTADGMDLGSARVYADVNAIFKVGAAAVCVKRRRTRDLPALFAFVDELAIASQIIDDLHDIEEDLARRRFNFAANRLGIDRDLRQNGASARLARAVLIEDGIGLLVDDVERGLNRAAAAIAPMGLHRATAYVDKFRRDLATFRQSLHRTRVEHLLGFLTQDDRGSVPAS